MWEAVRPSSEPLGTIIDSAATAKSFMTTKCITAVSPFGNCISSTMKPIADAIKLPECAGLVADESFCRTDPAMMNETCAMAFGTAYYDVDELVVKAIWTTGVRLMLPFSCVLFEEGAPFTGRLQHSADVCLDSVHFFAANKLHEKCQAHKTEVTS
jgi:hypothetical protein